MPLSPQILNIFYRVSNNDPTLTVIDLSATDEPIGPEGAILLADALKINTTIISLNLAFNDIGDNGVMALTDALKTNTTITSLNLAFNDIGDNGVMALTDALKTNTTITSFLFHDNNIDDKTYSNFKNKQRIIFEKNKEHIKQVFDIAKLGPYFQHNGFCKQLYKSQHLIKAIKNGYITVEEVHEYVIKRDPYDNMNFAHYTDQIIIDFLTGHAELDDKQKCILDFPHIIRSHLSSLIECGDFAAAQFGIKIVDIKDCSKFLEDALFARPYLENPKLGCGDTGRSEHDIESQRIYDKFCNEFISRLPASEFGILLTQALECMNTPFVELMVQYMCAHKATHPVSGEVMSAMENFLSRPLLKDVHSRIEKALHQLTGQCNEDATSAGAAAAAGDDTGASGAAYTAQVLGDDDTI